MGPESDAVDAKCCLPRPSILCLRFTTRRERDGFLILHQHESFVELKTQSDSAR